MLANQAVRESRFFVRMGGIGWMIYDRERKAPALIGTELAARLTREQAEQLLHKLLPERTTEPKAPRDLQIPNSAARLRSFNAGLEFRRLRGQPASDQTKVGSTSP